MGIIRLPYSLAIRDMFPKSEVIANVDEKTKMPINSTVVSFIISVSCLQYIILLQKQDYFLILIYQKYQLP